nr:AraC family transcriptional regulator [Bradyrhizobium betae]
MMSIGTQVERSFNRRDCSLRDESLPETAGLYQEQSWRRVQPGLAARDIVISRWTDLQNATLRAEATTPPDQYFLGIALKATRLTLAGDGQAIFDGNMPAGTLYVSAPSKRIIAQFHSPFDFLHFRISADYMVSQQSTRQLRAAESMNELVLLRDPLVDQLAKALTGYGDPTDGEYAHCIGRTLAMHVARLERPQIKVNGLPKWRLRRVEEYVKAHFDRGIGLSDLANIAGLSRMHFAAQFRIATGYRPHEYLQHQRIEHAKSLLSTTETPLVEVALAVGFCTQAHFSTVFKRTTGETPARWRSESKNAFSSVQNAVQCEHAGRATTQTIAARPCESRNGSHSRSMFPAARPGLASLPFPGLVCGPQKQNGAP